MAVVVKKALAYITRENDLLVFRHRDFPDAGLQVLAGTVEEGEDTRSAVLREVFEESGLSEVRIIDFMGRYCHDMAPYRDEMHERFAYHLELTGPAPDEWLHWETDPSDGGPAIAFCFFWIRLDDPELSLSGRQGEILWRLGRKSK